MKTIHQNLLCLLIVSWNYSRSRSGSSLHHQEGMRRMKRKKKMNMRMLSVGNVVRIMRQMSSGFVVISASNGSMVNV